MFGMPAMSMFEGGGASASGGGGSYDWMGPMIGNMAGSMFQNDMNRTNADHAMDRSSAEADKQMNFQRQMSNTSFQRGVADMKAAGINPMIAATQGGASTPGGAAGSSSMAQAQNPLASGISSAIDMKRLEKELNQADAGIALDRANATNSLAQANAAGYSAKYTDTQTKAIGSQLDMIDAKAKADAAKARIDLKATGYDAVMSRASRDVGTAANAAGAISKFLNPGKAIDPRKYFYGSKSTGEIFNP